MRFQRSTAAGVEKSRSGHFVRKHPVVRSQFPEQESCAITPPTEIPTPAALGLAARAARKQLGLTQPQLALAAGVGVRFIVDLEAGKPTLRRENILGVLHALGDTLAVIGLPAFSNR